MASRLSPGVHQSTITDSQVDLFIECHGVSIARFVIGGRLEKSLIVRVLVLLATTGRETKISQFDVATSVKQDIVRFDITRQPSQYDTCIKCSELTDARNRACGPLQWP